MTDALELRTALGPLILRPERSADSDFLFTVFRAHAALELTALPLNAAMIDHLVRMQFSSQTATYRTLYPDARFDIIERAGVPIGRMVVDDNADAACIVDLALLPEHRDRGLGTAIMTATLARLGGRPRPVRCQILCTNEPSIRMCRRAGFVQIGSDLPFWQFEWRAPVAPEP